MLSCLEFISLTHPFGEMGLSLLSRPSSTPDSDFVGVWTTLPIHVIPGHWHVEDPGPQAGGQNSLHIWILATCVGFIGEALGALSGLGNLGKALVWGSYGIKLSDFLVAPRITRF